MCRFRSIHFIVLFAATVLGQATGLMAEEPKVVKVNDEIVANLLDDATTKAQDAFDGVMRGDVSKVMPLLEKYIVPASISLVLIIMCYLAASAIGRMVSHVIADKVDRTLGRFAGKLVSNGLMLIVFLGILGKFGINVTSFTAILAASGFAIGMALQGALGNFAAGVMLLVFRPFKVDDFIRVAGSEGIVNEIDLFTTRLNTLDNRHLILPNGEVFGSTIENLTHNKVRRVDVAVGVAYDADLRQTRQVLESAIHVIPGAAPAPPAQVVLVDLGGSSVNWEVRVWTRPENYLDVKQHVTAAVKEALDAAQIGIPFPQMELHVARAAIDGLRAAA